MEPNETVYYLYLLLFDVLEINGEIELLKMSSLVRSESNVLSNVNSFYFIGKKKFF